MWPPAKVDGVWPFNDAWLRTSLEEARRQTPRNVALLHSVYQSMTTRRRWRSSSIHQSV